MAAISTTEGSPSSSGQFGSFFRVRGTIGTFYRVETLPRGPSGYTFNLMVAATGSAGRASQRRGEHASRSQDDIVAGAEPCSVWAGRRVLECRCECVCWVGRGGRGQIYGVLTKAEHRHPQVLTHLGTCSMCELQTLVRSHPPTVSYEQLHPSHSMEVPW